MGSKFTLSMVCHLVMFRMQGMLNYTHVVRRFPEKLPGMYWFAKWCVIVYYYYPTKTVLENNLPEYRLSSRVATSASQRATREESRYKGRLFSNTVVVGSSNNITTVDCHHHQTNTDHLAQKKSLCFLLFCNSSAFVILREIASS